MTDPDPSRRHDQEEPDQNDVIAALADHAGQLPPAPVVVRGPNADRDRLTREAMADAGDRGVFFIPDELGLADDDVVFIPDDDAEPLEDAEARQRAATAGRGWDASDPGMWGTPPVHIGTLPLSLEIRDGAGNVLAQWDVDPDANGEVVVEWSIDGGFRAHSDVDSLADADKFADPDEPQFEVDPDTDYPDYPCPKDPDGLHFPGCGCEHY
jgi:hypothetical protein